MDEDVLDTPRDGLYIPSALLMMGMGILAYYMENPLIFVGGFFITLGLAGLKLYRGSGTTLFRGQNDLNDLEKEDPAFLTAHSKLKMYEMAVSEKVLINNDTSIYTVDLPSPRDTLGIKPGQQIGVRIEWDTKVAGGAGIAIKHFYPIQIRPGSFDIVVRHNRTPLNLQYKHNNVGGSEDMVGRYLDGMKVNQHIKVIGPIGKPYYSHNMVKELLMVCRDTGIQAMLPIINEIIYTPEDLTWINLIWETETADAAFVHDDLAEIARIYPRIKIRHIITGPGHDSEETPASTHEGRLGYSFGSPISDKHVAELHDPQLEYDESLVIVSGKNPDDSLHLSTEAGKTGLRAIVV